MVCLFDVFYGPLAAKVIHCQSQRAYIVINSSSDNDSDYGSDDDVQDDIAVNVTKPATQGHESTASVETQEQNRAGHQPQMDE